MMSVSGKILSLSRGLKGAVQCWNWWTLGKILFLSLLSPAPVATARRWTVLQRMSAAGRRKLGRPSTTQKVNVTYCIHLLPCTGCSAFSCTYLLQASLSVFLSVQTTRISATWTTLGAATFIATKEPNQS